MDYLDYEGLLRYDELIKKDISNKVIGPSSSTNTHVVVFDGTTGKLVKDSGFTISKSVPSNAVFTDTTYSIMGASGSTHASGLVPDTPSVAGTTKYLREDGTWQTPPDNNTWRPVSDSVSSTSSSDAASSKAVKTAYDLAASKTANTGTVTSVAVKMNGATKGTVTTSGTIDLGTVLTSHQDISGKADKTTTVNGHALSSNVTVTKSDVGLGNVTNDSQVKRSEMGAASGVATLDSNGKVPSSQLPSYVDDVIEGYFYNSKFYKESAHTTEITGETGKIYVDLSTNKTYRWGGSAYAVISETLALGETSSTAYRGDRGKTAYTHSQTTSGNPHNVTKSDVGLGNVGNFKAVSTVASQGLTDTEKSNARANIGAGTSSFSGSYNDLSNKPTIPAAAANGTYTVKTLVGSTTTNVSDFTANQSSADDVTFVQGSNVTITPDATNRKITIAATDTKYTAGTDRLYFIGDNPTGGSANDTMTFWAGKGNGIAYFSTTGQLNNQPQQYGFMINLVSGHEVQQLWFGQTGGMSYKRGGNRNTTSMGAWTACDTTYSSKTAASGGTDVSLVTTGEKYTWNSKTSNTGTVTKVTAGTGLTGGDITTTGTIALATSGVTAGTYKRVTVDIYGRVTSGDNTDSDTKNTAGTTNKTDTKMFLVAATEQSANPVTYSNSNCYIGTDNCLYSGGAKVLTSYTNTTYAAGTGVTISGSNNAINVAYGTTANTACQGNDSRLSNARPASDVSDWAKAASKPSYGYSEIGYTVNSVTSAGGTLSLDGAVPLHVVTLTGNVSALTLSANPPTGHSCHVILTSTAERTVAIAHDSTNRVCPEATDVSISIKANGYVEIDFLNANGKIYVRGV